MTQDMWGRIIAQHLNADGTVDYSATNPDGSDSGIRITSDPAVKPIEAVLTTFNAMAPPWYVPPAMLQD